MNEKVKKEDIASDKEGTANESIEETNSSKDVQPKTNGKDAVQPDQKETCGENAERDKAKDMPSDESAIEEWSLFSYLQKHEQEQESIKSSRNPFTSFVSFWKRGDGGDESSLGSTIGGYSLKEAVEIDVPNGKLDSMLGAEEDEYSLAGSTSK